MPFIPVTHNSRLGQRDTEISSSWEDETKQMLLQNPETGSYFIPTSSGKLFCVIILILGIVNTLF